MANKNYRKRKRNSYNKDGLSRETLIAVFISAVAVFLIVGLVVINNQATSASDQIDRATYCRKDGAQEITVILIDHTDKINATQHAALEKRLWDVANGITKNSVIKVFDVDKITDHVLLPDIDLCNPGDETSVNELTGNKELAKKHYEKKFKEPMNQMLERIFNSNTADESPIMESLQSVVVTSFIGNTNKAAKKKLILVSDLLQYNKNFSLYKEVPDFEVYKDSPHWKSVKSDMNGVEVEIFFLRRDGADSIQTTQLRNFWVKFFEGQGAIVNRFLPIEG